MNDPTPQGEVAPGQHVARPLTDGDAEPFVPLTKRDLIERLIRHAGLDGPAAAGFRRLCRQIEAAFHHEFHDRQERLRELYAPFDPDVERRPAVPEATARGEAIDEFLAEFSRVLAAAHYFPVSEQELEQALSGTTYWGLKLQVDRDIFERLLIYARRSARVTRVRRDIGTLFRPRELSLDLYGRLVLGVKLRPDRSADEQLPTGHLHLKLFRDIPKLDLEMLLPGTRPRMRWIDRVLVGLPSGGGMFTIFKLLFWPVVFGVLFWFSLAVAALAYGSGSLFGYLRTRRKYEYSLTESLYYQNLDNNEGVFCRIITEAEDEETKEAILAYFFLWQRGDGTWTPERLGGEIEAWLARETGERCHFQWPDALTKLKRLGALDGPEEQLRPLPPDRAVQRLAATWPPE